MSTQHNLYIIGSSPVVVASAGSGSGRDVTIQNVNETGYVYIGGLDVSTTSYGHRISPGGAISFELAAQDSLSAVCSNEGMTVPVISINLEYEN